GYSHRRFIALFRGAIGLTPKEYARVMRFDRALALAADPARPWAEIAVEAGYADQAHLSREFSALAGMAPQAWRRPGATSPRPLAVPAHPPPRLASIESAPLSPLAPPGPIAQQQVEYMPPLGLGGGNRRAT
ncbi:helix-turn-helix domain-containing protein, partial [Variovorax sp. CT11-76]